MYSEERPWGSFYVLDEATRLQGEAHRGEARRALSLQSHKHRGEHWTVVNGMPP